MVIVRTVIALVVWITAAGAAGAADYPQEAKKLVIKDGRRSSLVWTTKLPSPMLPATSPLVVGATLHVTAGSGESASIDLPAAGWSVNSAGTVYKFKNPESPGG